MADNYIKILSTNNNIYKVEVSEKYAVYSFGVEIKHVNSDYAASLTDAVIFITPDNSDISITLPSATNSGGKRLVLKRRHEGEYSVTVFPQMSELIDGYHSISMNYMNESITLVSDNTNWCII